ncbi:MAG: Ig-like domain-containing protein [Myxococcales bacterium]|nr:Ig-like domain-containing protein [Myxococcales bacterium]
MTSPLSGCTDDGANAGNPPSTPSDTETADVADSGEDLAGDAVPTDGSSVDAVTDAGPLPRPYPEPDAWPANEGPGIGAVTFTEDQLYTNCAFLDPGRLDVTDHHNLVTMLNGYLVMPWAPEFSQGGITFFDISDPCSPTVAGTGFSETMRETHAIGFMIRGDERWAAVDSFTGIFEGGIEFWDISDITAPARVSVLNLPGFVYPDAYARVTISLFWQAPWVYVAGSDNGVYVVDASDPLNPQFVTQYTFDPVLRVGQVQVIGNLLIATAAEGARTVLLDVSDPANPIAIPGGDFLAIDETGEPKEAYFTNFSNGYVWYARKQGGGGVMVMDIRDPSAPAYAGSYRSDGNGGYVFIHENYAFVGESRDAVIYDISDLTNIQPVATFDLEGDLDTMTPIGHLAVLSVDDKAIANQGSAIAPWSTTPDVNPPAVTWSWPTESATGLPLTSRIGVSFGEAVDAGSVFEGSVRLYVQGTDPAMTRVDGQLSAQENIVNFSPLAPLAPGTTYVLEIPAGGVVDFAGNAIVEPFSLTFTTAE